jgi:LAS superfamily LD-carboxypeptidase LdcB
MSPRRRRNIFQTRDQRFNYRFGNPAMRRRYRVRSKRRLIIAICVLLLLLILAGIALAYFFRNDDSKADSQTAPAAATEETAAETDTQSADTQDADEQPAADSEQAEQTAEAAALPPVAVTARSLAAEAGAAAADTESAEAADTETQEETAASDAAETAAVPLLGTPHDTVVNMVETRRSDWRLLLVNEWHPIPEDFNLTTLTLLNGLDIDERAAEDLDAMIDDCYAAGYAPEIASAYRSTDYQQQLFDELIYSFMDEGYSEEEARSKASETIATPGTSEHECGLAVDIVDMDYPYTDDGQAQTGTQQWLLEHSWEYGFILRYPEDKSSITGKVYEPWHYRYVGREYARDMHEKGLCLEEYVWQVDHTDAEASAAD